MVKPLAMPVKPLGSIRISKDVRLLAIVFIVGFMIGSTLVVTRFGLGQFTPLTFVSLRLGFTSAAFIAIYAASRKRRFPRSRHFWLRGAVWAFFGTVIPMSLITTSLLYQSSGLASLLITSHPAVVAIMAHFAFPDERMDFRKAAGVLLSLAGTIIVILKGESGSASAAIDWRGPTLVMLGVLSASSSLIFVRRTMGHYQALDIAMARILLAFPVVVMLAMATGNLKLSGGQPSGNFALLYAALVGTFGALTLGVYLLQRFGASYATQPGYIQPVVASIGGVLFLDEQISGTLVLGIMIVLLGIWLVSSGADHGESVPGITPEI